MEQVTVGKKFNAGKIAYARCVCDENLDDIQIKNKCFLLLVVFEGSLCFRLGNTEINANAPCFICFNEKENPVLIERNEAHYYAIYFHPTFLCSGMSFALVRSADYKEVAHAHDMFLLAPFTNEKHVVPLCDSYIAKTENACREMKGELTFQRDWYWSCRGRSYFMEIIIALERMYGIINENKDSLWLKNDKLREAVLYIESNYSDDISLSDIATACGLNHTTLTKLMKSGLGCTVMKYLTDHRIAVAKKLLAFTEVPIKDICNRVGFKTVQHFSRVFKVYTGRTPADFRRHSAAKRKAEFSAVKC